MEEENINQPQLEPVLSEKMHPCRGQSAARRMPAISLAFLQYPTKKDKCNGGTFLKKVLLLHPRGKEAHTKK